MVCTYTPDAGLGSMGYGSGPFGSATEDAWRLVGVVQATANQLIATVDGAGELGAPLDLGSPRNPANWQISLVSLEGRERIVQWVEPLNDAAPWELAVYLDGPLTGGSEYEIQLTLQETILTGCYRDTLTAITGVPVAKPGDRGFPELPGIVDLANPPTEASRIAVGHAYLGSLGYDAAGDLVNDFGIESLRKRVYRRITTARGGFFHLPDYGSALGIKEAVTPGQLLAVQRRVEEQVLREPDVVRASVLVSRPTEDPAIVVIRVTVQTASGESVTVESRDA